MADNTTLNPGTGGDNIASDDIGGIKYQRVKPAWGVDGSAVDASEANPLPVADSRAEDLLAMLSRVVKLLESNAVVDQQQRQRITLDAIAGSLTLGTVSTISSVSNLAATAGMDREQHINTAKQTYASSIRSRLEFV
jgi:hypothetical protein